MASWRRVGPAASIGVVAGLMGIFLARWAPFGSPLDGWSGSDATATWVTIGSGLGCAAVILAVMAPGWRGRGPELRTVTVALLIASGFTVVAGVSMRNAGTAGAAALAGLLGLPAALATLAPSLGCGRRFPSRSRGPSPMRTTGAAAVGASIVWLALLAGRPAISLDGLAMVRGAMFLVVGVLTSLLVDRHLWLWRVGRHRASLNAVAAAATLGVTWAISTVTTPTSGGWWTAHAIDFASVVALSWAVSRYPSDRQIADLFAPVTNRDPAVALELGLDDEVRRFVASLQQKDAQTRDHVARTAELAIRSAIRAGLRPDSVRAVGLGALLHDIGKIAVPIEILTKPGRLDPTERAVIEGHAAAGADIVARSPALVRVAPIVRWHHERFDGSGYPDGLSGPDLPLEVAIVSVCDAWDAMTWVRHYRGAMTHEQAIAILEAGSGSQWSPRAVALVTAEVRSWDTVEPHLPRAFDRTGTEPADLPLEVCGDALCGVDLARL